MKRLAAIATVLVLIFASCGKADVVIRTGVENTRPYVTTAEPISAVPTAATNEAGQFIYLVNTSSKTFHINGECRAAKAMSDKNRSTVVSSGVDEMISLGYKPCTVCFGDMSGK